MDAEVQQPFDDVQLGPMLGQGSYGKVFRGRWNGTDVAVKVGIFLKFCSNLNLLTTFYLNWHQRVHLFISLF